MPAGFRRHFVGKIRRNVCYSAVTEIGLLRLVGDHVDIFLNEQVKFYLSNTVNLHRLNSTQYATLYPQNDDHIVTIA